MGKESQRYATYDIYTIKKNRSTKQNASVSEITFIVFYFLQLTDVYLLVETGNDILEDPLQTSLS